MWTSNYMQNILILHKFEENINPSKKSIGRTSKEFLNWNKEKDCKSLKIEIKKNAKSLKRNLFAYLLYALFCRILQIVNKFLYFYVLWPSNGQTLRSVTVLQFPVWWVFLRSFFKRLGVNLLVTSRVFLERTEFFDDLSWSFNPLLEWSFAFSNDFQRNAFFDRNTS